MTQATKTAFFSSHWSTIIWLQRFPYRAEDITTLQVAGVCLFSRDSSTFLLVMLFITSAASQSRLCSLVQGFLALPFLESLLLVASINCVPSTWSPGAGLSHPQARDDHTSPLYSWFGRLYFNIYPRLHPLKEEREETQHFAVVFATL